MSWWLIPLLLTIFVASALAASVDDNDNPLDWAVTFILVALIVTIWALYLILK
jgi:hypothetical protein